MKNFLFFSVCASLFFFYPAILNQQPVRKQALAHRRPIFI